jgi:hypothetical protein
VTALLKTSLALLETWGSVPIIDGVTVGISADSVSITTGTGVCVAGSAAIAGAVALALQPTRMTSHALLATEDSDPIADGATVGISVDSVPITAGRRVCVAGSVAFAGAVALALQPTKKTLIRMLMAGFEVLSTMAQLPNLRCRQMI